MKLLPGPWSKPRSPLPRKCASRQRRWPPAAGIAIALTLSLSAQSETRNSPGPIPDNCPVTRPLAPRFVPPAPYQPDPPDSVTFWYGTDALFVDLHADGRWRGITEAGKTRNKLFWFRKDAKWIDEYPYLLSVTAKRIDVHDPTLIAPRVTNAIMGKIEAMLVMLELPQRGCWQVTGNYKSGYLTFVTWVD